MAHAGSRFAVTSPHTVERRQHQRFNRPFDGIWKAPSGSGPCRISDISAGGCFIESLALPPVGETAHITLQIGEHAMSFTGDVLYSVRNMGFAVKFHPLAVEQHDALQVALASLESQ